jgi:hypothetical protein
MAAKKTTKRAQNSAAKQRKRPRGKPFEPGNAYRWRPGVSPNPGGRPKSKHLSKAGAEYLALPSAECPDITNAEHIIAVVGALGKAGDLEAVKWLADRTEGKLPQSIDLAVDDRKRELIENAIAKLAEETGVTLEEAAAALAAVAPDVEWIH